MGGTHSLSEKLNHIHSLYVEFVVGEKHARIIRTKIPQGNVVTFHMSFLYVG